MNDRLFSVAYNARLRERLCIYEDWAARLDCPTPGLTIPPVREHTQSRPPAPIAFSFER